MSESEHTEGFLSNALNDLARLTSEMSKSKGFWQGEPNLAEKVALIHSEASELLEAYRKNPKADCGKMFPDTYSNAEQGLTFSGGKFSHEAVKVDPARPIGLTLEEEELADIIIRVLDLSGHRGVNIGRAVLVKMQYNQTRPHKHGKQF